MTGHPALAPGMWCAVQLRIADLLAGGGPTGADFARVRGNADLVACGSDNMLFRGKQKPGVAAELFNTVADALAVMAFVPGGVRFAGEHFAAGPLNEKG